MKREEEARNLALYYLGKASPVPQDGMLIDDSAELSALLEFYFVQILMPQKDLEVRCVVAIEAPVYHQLVNSSCVDSTS